MLDAGCENTAGVESHISDGKDGKILSNTNFENGYNTFENTFVRNHPFLSKVK